MPNSGKARRRKRHARQAVERQLIKQHGDHWQEDSSKETRENLKLIRQAARWQTTATAETFEDHDPKVLSAKQLAILMTTKHMLSPDPKVSAAGVANLLKMEQQNQNDQKLTKQTEEGKEQVGDNIQVNVVSADPNDVIAALVAIDKVRGSKQRRQAVDSEFVEGAFVDERNDDNGTDA